MQKFVEWLRWQESSKVPDDAVRIHLPKVEQTTSYSCGAASLRAIADFFGVGPEEEKDWIALLHSDPEEGTLPTSIVKVARSLGLHAIARQGMTIDSLKSRLEKKIPVICAVQAWGDIQKYPTKDASGHYVVAIGFDNEKIYFEDPSLQKTRGFLTYRDFLDRWHDTDGKGKKYTRLGIAIWDVKEPDKIKVKQNAQVIETTEIP